MRTMYDFDDIFTSFSTGGGVNLLEDDVLEDDVLEGDDVGDDVGDDAPGFNIF